MTYLPPSTRTPVGLDAHLADLSTKFLWHCEGTEGQQVGTDSSVFHLPVSYPTPSNNAHLTTSDKQFGTSSVVFDGTVTSKVLVDNSSGAIKLGANDFTIECWVKIPLVDPSGLQEPIWSMPKAHDTQGILFIHEPGATQVNFSVYFSQNGGTGWTSLTNTYGTSMTRGAWHHVAVCRDDCWVLLYLDLVLNNTRRLDLGSVIDSYDRLFLGHWPYWGGDTYPRTMYGNIDEFKITCGKNMFPGGLYDGGAPSGVSYPLPTQAYTDPILPASASIGTMKTDGINGMYVRSPGTGIWTRVDDVSVDPRYPRLPS